MNEPFKAAFDDEYIIVVDKIAKVLIQPSSEWRQVSCLPIINFFCTFKFGFDFIKRVI